jgi:hypothetical protein
MSTRWLKKGIDSALVPSKRRGFGHPFALTFPTGYTEIAPDERIVMVEKAA